MCKFQIRQLIGLYAYQKTSVNFLNGSSTVSWYRSQKASLVSQIGSSDSKMQSLLLYKIAVETMGANKSYAVIFLDVKNI